MKKIIVLASAVLAMALGLVVSVPVTHAAIAFDATSTQGQSGATVSPATWSHTVTGSNTVLDVCIEGNGTSDFSTGASYNGVAMTKVATKLDNTNGIFVDQYQLFNAATGAHNVSTTFTTGSGKQILAGAISFSGASAFDASGTKNGTIPPQPSSSLTTVANNSWVVDCVGINDNTAITKAAGQTQAVQNNAQSGDFHTLAMSYKGAVTPAGSTQMSWTGGTNGDNWVALSVSISPSGGVVSNPTPYSYAITDEW